MHYQRKHFRFIRSTDFKSLYPKNIKKNSTGRRRGYAALHNNEYRISHTHNTTSQHHHEIQSKLIEIQFVIVGSFRVVLILQHRTPKPGNSISQNNYHHCRFTSASTTNFNAIMFQVLLLYINHPQFPLFSLRGLKLKNCNLLITLDLFQASNGIII